MAEKDNKYNFSGYATKYGMVCADGRTIQKGAFKHNDGQRIPLVWLHLHNDPNNILGHAILEHRDDGVYAYCYLNDGASGKQAKTIVEHKDVESLSIYANKLVEKSNLVHKGEIRELSLVLSGANPGALIEHITLSHSDGSETESEDEAIISMHLPLELVANKEITIEHADNVDEGTVGSVVESMTDVQKKVMYALLAQALSESGGEAAQSNTEGETFMKKNLFDREEENETGPHLTHSQIQEFAQSVFDDMTNKKYNTFKESFLAHAGTYGIGSDRANLALLFPDARALDNEPGFDTRRMSWVSGWMGQTRHTPFSRIKKLWGDLTADTARAKGYITGNEKIEQVFPILKRTTEPTTVYKKQKLDRDDIIDITDFSVVNWMWREMRFMLDEEVARAALVGDGRVFGVNADAIDPSKIRPIYGDVTQFVHYLTLTAVTTDYLDIMDAIQVARVNYKGTGIPNFYTTNAVLTGMLLVRDTTNRRMFRTVADVAAELRVAEIIEVQVFEGVQRDTDPGAPTVLANLLGIMVNPRDYTYGADKGGEVNTFDQFDIDFNQNKYLIETRVSGSLLEPKSALVVERLVA